MGSDTFLSESSHDGKINTLTKKATEKKKNHHHSSNSSIHVNNMTDTSETSTSNNNHNRTPQFHSISPMSFMASSSVGSSSATTNQSKENLNSYNFHKNYSTSTSLHHHHHVLPITTPAVSHSSRSLFGGGTATDRDHNDRDETSTQSSHFTHHSKGSYGSNSGSGIGGSLSLYRSKSRTIFSSSEKFQSHQDLKRYYEREEEFEQQQQQLFDLQLQQYKERQQLPQKHAMEDTTAADAATTSTTTMMMMGRTDPTSSLQLLQPTKFFGRDIRTWTNHSANEPVFDKYLRDFIDIHIAKARGKRQEKYLTIMKKIGVDDFDDLRYFNSHSISSNSYIPYPSLRHERRFLYDVETYPLHQHLADILGVSDLSLIHQHTIQDKKALMKPLLDGRKREAFHKCYDTFVTSFCIPLLHSLAMSDNLFNDSSMVRGGRDDSHQQRRISYRYQAFPCIRVNRPGEFSIGPHCDMAYGHSMGNINFHIPLTPTYGTNALYTESHPGREDWHPLKTKSIGLGYSFDGSRNLHFTLENTTNHTRVSIDFRIAIHRDTRKEIPPSLSPHNIKMMMDYNQMLKDALQEDEMCNDLHDVLCNKKMLEDNYSSFPGYYEEAHVELGPSSTTNQGHGPGPVVCKHNKMLMQPDKRVGFPF